MFAQASHDFAAITGLPLRAREMTADAFAIPIEKIRFRCDKGPIMLPRRARSGSAFVDLHAYGSDSGCQGLARTRLQPRRCISPRGSALADAAG